MTTQKFFLFRLCHTPQSLLSNSYSAPFFDFSYKNHSIIYIVMMFIFRMPQMILGPQDYIFL